MKSKIIRSLILATMILLCIVACTDLTPMVDEMLYTAIVEAQEKESSSKKDQTDTDDTTSNDDDDSDSSDSDSNSGSSNSGSSSGSGSTGNTDDDSDDSTDSNSSGSGSTGNTDDDDDDDDSDSSDSNSGSSNSGSSSGSSSSSGSNVTTDTEDDDAGYDSSITFTSDADDYDGEISSATGTEEGYEYVDLGLTSGLMWARMNIGAEAPEERGSYYAWGEITTKDEYSDDNCANCGLQIDDIIGNPEYDAAAAILGGHWRMPDTDEFQELIDECDWDWVKYNDVTGYVVTGPNGSSIFLPTSGYMYLSTLYYESSKGLYWSAIADTADTDMAYHLYFYSTKYDYSSFWNYRRNGRVIRAIYDEDFEYEEASTDTVSGSYLCENIITTYEFEAEDDLINSSWTAYTWARLSDYGITSPGYNDSEGCAYFTISDESSSNWDCQLFWTLDDYLEEGETYAYEFYAKTTCSAGHVVQFLTQNASYSGWYGDDYTVDTDWGYFTGSFTYEGTPTDANKVGIQFGGSDNAGETLYIDNFKFGITCTEEASTDTVGTEFATSDFYYKITSSSEVCVSYWPDENDAVSAINAKAYVGDMSIPSSVTYNGTTYSVTSINDSTFKKCTSLTSISIPESVTSIGDYAFYKCSSLTSITIPESVTSIGHFAFYYCTSLESVNFCDDSALTSIGCYTFQYCISLTDITIPESVTSIDHHAFCNCSSLTSIEIPSGVTSIGINTFYECRSLTSITIPKSVTSIGSYAFALCTSLTNITIPENVTTIISYAFAYCSLTSVTCLAASPPTIYSTTFAEMVSATLHVPSSALSDYQSADYWSDFSEILGDAD